MLSAAVYARKSTDQNVADEQKSITRQIDLAVACAKRQGFDVPPEHIYVDDAISGAEFERRPGLVRLLNALAPRAAFDALFLADKDRLGREQFETNHILKQISVAGVRIFEYQNGGHEVRLDSPIDKLIMSVSNFAAELERAKASQRTRDALELKARRGYVAGGAVFGYRNTPVFAEDRKSHVIREIHEDEAAIVRRIFAMASEGHGFKRITLTLNQETIASPRARRGRHRSWAPSSVRAILFNPLYKGEIVWGRTKKRDAWGRRKEAHRPAAEWITTTDEGLRIISDELWSTAHVAIATRRRGIGGRPTRGTESKYLLTGFLRCGVCGGAIVQGWQGFPGYPVYRCWYNQSRGRAVCGNTLTVPMELADAAVLRAIENEVLAPHIVEAAIELAAAGANAPERAGQSTRDNLSAELTRLEGELGKYAEAIAETGPLPSILSAIRFREDRRKTIHAELRKLPSAPKRQKTDYREIKNALRARVAEWRRLARENVLEGRRLLRAVIDDRIVFRPVPRPAHIPPRKGPGRKSVLIYEFEGTTTLSRVFADLISASRMVAPTGFEPVFQP